MLRPLDGLLWRCNEADTLRHMVADKLHTFDGAQGTGLACLIRRLRVRLQVAGDGLICAGMSVTINGDNPQELLGIRVADLRQSSDSDAIVGEVRQSIGSAADAWTTTCAIRPSHIHPAVGVPAPGRTARRSYRTL